MHLGHNPVNTEKSLNRVGDSPDVRFDAGQPVAVLDRPHKPIFGVGSTPTPATNFASVAELADAAALNPAQVEGSTPSARIPFDGASRERRGSPDSAGSAGKSVLGSNGLLCDDNQATVISLVAVLSAAGKPQAAGTAHGSGEG